MSPYLMVPVGLGEWHGLTWGGLGGYGEGWGGGGGGGGGGGQALSWWWWVVGGGGQALTRSWPCRLWHDGGEGVGDEAL